MQWCAARPEAYLDESSRREGHIHHLDPHQNPMSISKSSCVPPDAFWKLDKDLAEVLWQRQDGATVSTRLAEPIADLFNVPIQDAKAVLHGAAAIGAGVKLAKSVHPLVAVGLGLLLFNYLEQDRCA